MAQQPPRIVELADTISKSVAEIQGIINSQAAPSPSFGEDAAGVFPESALGARNKAIDAALELHDLLLEPFNLFFKTMANMNGPCLATLNHFNIPSIIPHGSSGMSYSELAQTTGQPEPLIRRLIHHAMTVHVFRETPEGKVAHTSLSKLMASNHAKAWMMTLTELWPASLHFPEALAKWPGSEDPTETSFSLSKNKPESFYQYCAQKPDLATAFAKTMEMMAARPGMRNSFLAEGYPYFAELGDKGVVIDLGGTHGHIAFAVARRHKHLNVVVQDLPETIADAVDNVPEDVSARVKLMAHDFFTEQPIKNADVYYFRWVFHNWGDLKSIQILKALIPALKPGARVVVMDPILPEPGVLPRWRENDLRSEDFTMKVVLNAHERSKAEWVDLFHNADTKFVLKEIYEPEGSDMGIIEFVWTP
ncbi:6-hydroxytryprostatin B O-methyltransferase [Podospora australis]|uniref:6-hydroxytryprostatin B O-methyltransferase n=1 Tax=Podospora australis TaxID=1536484 RepID=A0AAN6WJE0_9PEZI|nr:6-hydroxytryprostatin B O-methyltransferase [Podospora australis]